MNRLIFVFLIISLLLNIFLISYFIKKNEEKTIIGESKSFTPTPIKVDSTIISEKKLLTPTLTIVDPKLLIKYKDFFNIEVPKKLVLSQIWNQDDLIINDFITITNHDYNECFLKDQMCRGSCPIIKEKYVKMNGLRFLEREIEIGGIGGNIPTHTLSYGFVYKDRCLMFIATSFDYSLNKYLNESKSLDEGAQRYREVLKTLEQRNSPFELSEERKEILKKIVNSIKLIY